MHTKFWSENLKGKGHLEDLDVDEKIVAGSCEHGNETSASTEGGEFLDILSGY
jgi:hypothetical protein